MEQELNVPGFSDYTVTPDGRLISYKCGKRLVRAEPGKVRQRITLRDPQKKRHYLKIHRIVAAAKYGRWPNADECVRHKDGDPSNNSVMNLELGDWILNSIDDYIYGDKKTTIENIDHAIDLLMALREKMGG